MPRRRLHPHPVLWALLLGVLVYAATFWAIEVAWSAPERPMETVLYCDGGEGAFVPCRDLILYGAT